jgi:hypothetical protein
MLNPLKNFVFIIFITNIFLLVFSCTEKEEEKQEQEKKCPFFENNISPNFKTIWMDTSIANGEYPKMDTVLIRFGDNADGIVDRIMSDLYLLTEDWVNYPKMTSSEAARARRLNLSPITLWIEIKKDKKIDSLIASVWVTDENCKDYQKANISFYKYKETDSSYILTTQLIENGEYIAGRPIFLVGDIKNITNNRYDLILLNAVAESYYSFAEPMFKNPLMRIKRHINVEINVNGKKTLKTFVYVVPVG